MKDVVADRCRDISNFRDPRLCDYNDLNEQQDGDLDSLHMYAFHTHSVR